MPSIFSCDSEAFASELQESIEDMIREVSREDLVDVFHMI